MKDATLTNSEEESIPVVPEHNDVERNVFRIQSELTGVDQSLVRQGMTAIVQCPADYTLVGLYGYRAFLRFFNRL